MDHVIEESSEIISPKEAEKLSQGSQMLTHHNKNLPSSGELPSSYGQSKSSSIKIEHPAEQRPKERNCSICFQHFPDATDAFRFHLLNHMEAYRGKSVCPDCRVDCGHYEKMIDHFLMAHGGLDKLVCPYPSCVRSFRTSRTLELHAKRHKN